MIHKRGIDGVSEWLAILPGGRLWSQRIAQIDFSISRGMGIYFNSYGI
jgi:hypothetical protein